MEKELQKIFLLILHITYYNFNDSRRYLASSLSNLVNDLSEEIHRIKCKFGNDDKKCETFGIKYKYCDCFLEFTNFEVDLEERKCLYF